jgi:hypothetical protein
VHDDQVPSRDPLNLGAIDRDIRINELTEQSRELGLGSSHVDENCPPEAHEEFLRSVISYESAPIGSQFARLVKAGVELPVPDSLDEAALHAKLWEVINTLAKFETYVSHTDHLSDRQLYEHLWKDMLREETAMFPPGSGWRCYLDLIGGGSDEDIEIGLRYYDSEESRAHWASDFPGMVIPPHEDPPYDRDRHLPAADPELPEDDEGAEEI